MPEGVYMKSEKRVLFLLAASVVGIILVTVLTLFSGKDEPAGTKQPGKKPKAIGTISAWTGEKTAIHSTATVKK